MVCAQLFSTPWTVAHQALLSVGFSRQEHWSGLPFPTPGDLSDLGSNPRFLQPLQCSPILTTEPPGKPLGGLEELPAVDLKFTLKGTHEFYPVAPVLVTGVTREGLRVYALCACPWGVQGQGLGTWSVFLGTEAEMCLLGLAACAVSRQRAQCSQSV